MPVFLCASLSALFILFPMPTTSLSLPYLIFGVALLNKREIKSEVENTWTFGCFLNPFS
jgi:hypothetical protein